MKFSFLIAPSNQHLCLSAKTESKVAFFKQEICLIWQAKMTSTSNPTPPPKSGPGAAQWQHIRVAREEPRLLEQVNVEVRSLSVNETSQLTPASHGNSFGFQPNRLKKDIQYGSIRRWRWSSLGRRTMTRCMRSLYTKPALNNAFVKVASRRLVTIPSHQPRKTSLPTDPRRRSRDVRFASFELL